MFKNILDDFVKLSNELPPEDLDKIAVQILTSLEEGVVKIAEETPYQVENNAVTEEVTNNLKENPDYSTSLMARYQRLPPIHRMEYLERTNPGNVFNDMEEGAAFKLKTNMRDSNGNGEFAGRLGGAASVAAGAYLVPKIMKKMRKSASYSVPYGDTSVLDNDLQDTYRDAREEINVNSGLASNIYNSKTPLEKLDFLRHPRQPIDMLKGVAADNEVSIGNANKISYRDGIGDGAIQGAGAAGAVLGGRALIKYFKGKR